MQEAWLQMLERGAESHPRAIWDVQVLLLGAEADYKIMLRKSQSV